MLLSPFFSFLQHSKEGDNNVVAVAFFISLPSFLLLQRSEEGDDNNTTFAFFLLHRSKEGEDNIAIVIFFGCSATKKMTTSYNRLILFVLLQHIKKGNSSLPSPSSFCLFARQ